MSSEFDLIESVLNGEAERDGLGTGKLFPDFLWHTPRKKENS